MFKSLLKTIADLFFPYAEFRYGYLRDAHDEAERRFRRDLLARIARRHPYF